MRAREDIEREIESERGIGREVDREVVEREGI